MHTGSIPTTLPDLEIISTTGSPDVAEIFVARTRPGSDTSLIEFVDGLDWRHPRESKWIINVSTQFGCPVGCSFCDAAHRYFGNLTAAEMLAQVGAVLARHPGLAANCKKLKVHFARMGEPALNDEVLRTLARLPAFARAPGLWACVATTAPAGREDWFNILLGLKEYHFHGRFQLQFSLNTTDENFRRTVTPISLKPFSWINDYATRFHSPGERRVVLNFALAESTPFDMRVLKDTFDPTHTAVKLTPMNPTDEGRAAGIRTLSPRALEARAMEARAAGFDTIISVGDPREDEIGSNCGQSVRRIAETRP